MRYQKFKPVEILSSFVESYFTWETIEPLEKELLVESPPSGFCPGGSHAPLRGKENLRTQWWAPLPTLVTGVDIIDSFVNDDETAVTIEFHCHITQPACTLRIIDRFIVNENGEITAQENFFDPRDITNPGWRS